MKTWKRRTCLGTPFSATIAIYVNNNRQQCRFSTTKSGCPIRFISLIQSCIHGSSWLFSQSSYHPHLLVTALSIPPVIPGLPVIPVLSVFPGLPFHNPENTKRRPAYASHTQDVQSKKAASYSPASHRSTIGATGLNFSVRNGKRWDTGAITTK